MAAVYLGFKSKVTAALNEKVSLDQLVFIQGQDSSQALKDLLAGLTITNQGTIKSEQVLKRLKQEESFNTVDLVWRGEETLVIRAPNDSPSEPQMLSEAKKVLETELAKNYDNFKVEASNHHFKLRTAQTFDGYSFKLAKNFQLKRRVAVTINLLNTKEVVHTQSIWFKVSVFERVLTAKREIKARESYQKSLVSFELTDIARAKGEYFFDLPQGEFWFKRNVNVGKPITKKVLVAEPDVKRKQKVTIAYSDKAVAIEAKGIAQNSGFVGETILVKLAESNKSVKAVVQGKNRARVLNE